MNTEFKKNVEALAEWIEALKEAAKDDNCFSISWFKENDFDGAPFCIVGGWAKGFSEDFADILCVSKSNPEYAMCIKIAVNEGPDSNPEFDKAKMPVDKNGVIEDTLLAIEQDDDPIALAHFFWNELERITKDYEENKQ